jgi:kinesin family member 15
VRENHRTNGALTFSCRCSFYEIYQEKVYDLLDVAGSAQAAGLNVREDSKLGVFIEGLVDEVVATSEDAARVLARGYGNRRVGETAMNRESSRSHAVFLLKIDRFEDNEETKVRSNRSAKFSLVDLAGSERQRDTNASGERLKEAGQINKSLSTLGNVINALASNAMSGGTQKKHIQYRDSKLTFLLRDSFGGNSKTLLIATASPNEHSMAETLSTLKFAKRAKMIKTAAVLNEESSGSVHSLQKEITALRAKIVEMETIAQDRVLSGDGRKSTGRISTASVPVEKEGPFSVVPNAMPLFEALERCKVVDEQCIRAELKSLGLSKRLEQADSFSMSLKMKLKMRDAELSKLKKKSEDEPVPSIEEIVKAETAVVREELQSEIIRLRAHCEDLERKLRADEDLTKWNCEKEVKFSHETVECLASLRDTYTDLCAKFEALRNDDFEATFGFPYASVGVLKTEHADLTVALREEQAKNSGLSHEAKVLLERTVSTEKSLNDLKLELQRKTDSERIVAAQLNASIEELQRECVEKNVLINRLQSDLTLTSQSVQDDMRARELEHRAKYNAAMKDNMILLQKVRELEFSIEKNEELIVELEAQVSSGLQKQQQINDALEASRVQYAKSLKTLTDEMATVSKALENSQEVIKISSLRFKIYFLEISITCFLYSTIIGQ